MISTLWAKDTKQQGNGSSLQAWWPRGNTQHSHSKQGSWWALAKTRQREGKHILLEKNQGNRERKVPSTGYICWRRLCSLCGLQRFYNLQLSQIWKIHSWMKKHKRVLLRLQDIKYICLLKHSTQKTRSHSTQNFWHIHTMPSVPSSSFFQMK